MKLNKYKTQETFCYSLITTWVIGIIIIMITSSCSTSGQIVHKKPVGYQKFHQYTCPAYTN